LNIQIEHLDNHSARLTVQVDEARFAEARKSTVRKISAKINIPGFRKGKAPAQMVARQVGEAYILEETIEELGQTLYKDVLTEQDLDPAGPGTIENFELEPQPTFTYTVPLAPTVSLGEYHSVRADWVDPVIGDKDVEAELRGYQREFAETAVSDAPAEVGNRITADLHSFFVDSEAETADVDVHDRKEEPYIHRHGAVLDLGTGDDEPLAPGFTEKMVGATVGETRTFLLSFGEGEGVNPDLANKTVEFVVTVDKIETVVLPELDDALAAKVSERFGWNEPVEAAEAAEVEAEVSEEAADAVDSDEAAEAESDSETDEAGDENEDNAFSAPETRPLTLSEARAKLAETLQEQAIERNREQYANKVLEQVVEGAEVAYNEVSLEQEIDDLVEEFKQRLAQSQYTLDLYLRSSGMTLEDLRTNYRPTAERSLRRGLVMREFLKAEKLGVTESDLSARLESVLSGIGGIEMAQQMGLLNDSRFAENLANRILQDKLEARAVAIGRGEAEAIVEEADAAEAEEAAPAEAAETDTVEGEADNE
jgi:trigger factor